MKKARPKKGAERTQKKQQTEKEALYLKQKFAIEMNAKNEAYDFILSSGLLPMFVKWHSLNHNRPHLAMIRAYLLLESTGGTIL